MRRVIVPLLALGACGPPIPKGAEEGVLQCGVEHFDTATVDAAHVDAGVLSLSMSYTGGCKEHTFYACWNGEFQGPDTFNPANPPRVEVQIGHHARGDRCEEEVTEDVPFFLSYIRHQYETVHPDPGDRLVLLVGDLTLQYPLQ